MGSCRCVRGCGVCWGWLDGQINLTFSAYHINQPLPKQALDDVWLLDRINASGSACLSQARVAGRFALRLAIGGPLSERRHVEQVWNTLAALAGSA